MSAFHKFDNFLVHLGTSMNMSTDVLGGALSNELPVKNYEFLADIAEIVPGNGYSAGGPDIVILSWNATTVAGQVKLVTTSPIITAGGGSIAAFRYAILYNKTVSNGPLISWYDYGSSKIIGDTEAIKLQFDDGSGNGSLIIGP